jgi:hypothetical protein
MELDRPENTHTHFQLRGKQQPDRNRGQEAERRRIQGPPQQLIIPLGLRSKIPDAERLSLSFYRDQSHFLGNQLIIWFVTFHSAHGKNSQKV